MNMSWLWLPPLYCKHFSKFIHPFPQPVRNSVTISNSQSSAAPPEQYLYATEFRATWYFQHLLVLFTAHVCSLKRADRNEDKRSDRIFNFFFAGHGSLNVERRTYLFDSGTKNNGNKIYHINHRTFRRRNRRLFPARPGRSISSVLSQRRMQTVASDLQRMHEALHEASLPRQPPEAQRVLLRCRSWDAVQSRRFESRPVCFGLRRQRWRGPSK